MKRLLVITLTALAILGPAAPALASVARPAGQHAQIDCTTGWKGQFTLDTPEGDRAEWNSRYGGPCGATDPWQIRGHISCEDPVSGARGSFSGGWVYPNLKKSQANCQSPFLCLLHAYAQFRTGPGFPIITKRFFSGTCPAAFGKS